MFNQANVATGCNHLYCDQNLLINLFQIMKLLDASNNHTSITYDISQLNHQTTSKFNNTLNILFLNIRSLRMNFSNLYGLLHKSKRTFHAIALNETWLEGDEHLAYGIPDYTTYSLPRNKNGGGLLIYCRNDIDSELIPDISFISNDIESLFIKIKLKSETINFGTIYKPPKTKITKFTTELENKTLNKINSTNNSIIAGDFNLNLFENLTNKTQNFITAMKSKNLSNIISDATREVETKKSSSKTLIDHIWVSGIETLQSFVIREAISDHYPVGASFKLHNNDEIKWIKFRTKSDRQFKEFIKEFSNYLLDINPEDIENSAVSFLQDLSALISKHFPIILRKSKIRNVKSPWITKELENLIDKKYILFRKYKSNLITFNKYKQYRNMLTKTLKLARKIYFKKQFEAITSPKDMWAKINRIIKPTKSATKIIIEDNSTTINKPELLSEKFNDDFLDSVKQITSEMNNVGSTKICLTIWAKEP